MHPAHTLFVLYHHCEITTTVRHGLNDGRRILCELGCGKQLALRNRSKIKLLDGNISKQRHTLKVQSRLAYFGGQCRTQYDYSRPGPFIPDDLSSNLTVTVLPCASTRIRPSQSHFSRFHSEAL